MEDYSAAVEVVKLGHCGIDYVSRLLGAGPKTIRRGIREQLATDRQRKKGADANC